MALRASVDCGASWTLMALVVRTGSALGLSPLDTPSHAISSAKAAEREQNHRLWFCVGLFDIQVSLDRGSKPLLAPGEFCAPPSGYNHSMSPSQGQLPAVEKQLAWPRTSDL